METDAVVGTIVPDLESTASRRPKEMTWNDSSNLEELLRQKQYRESSAVHAHGDRRQKFAMVSGSLQVAGYITEAHCR